VFDFRYGFTTMVGTSTFGPWRSILSPHASYMEDRPIRPTREPTTLDRREAMILVPIRYEHFHAAISKFLDLNIGGSRLPVFET